MPYDPNELVNLIFGPESNSQANRMNIRLADAIDAALKVPEHKKRHWMIVRDGESIDEEKLFTVAKELGIIR